MGLFDFLKKKDEPAATPPVNAPQPAAPAPTEASSPAPAQPAPAKPEGGPRYQRPAFAAKSAADIQPSFSATAPPMPPMPEPPPLPFEPSNNLEQVLLLAAQDPQYRLAFYHELMQAELFVLTNAPEGAEAGEVTVAEGTEVQLHVLHDGRLPIFSSIDRIFEGGAQQGEVSYLRVPAPGFFQMTQGADCVLNPFSPFGKLLVAPEIEDMVTGRIFNPPAEGQEAGPQAQLLPLPEPPAGLASALREFCAQHAHIMVAYLAQVQIEGEEAPSRLLLAFGVEDENMDFLQEMGPAIQEHLEQTAIDVARLSPDPNEPLTAFFTQQEPVYLRADLAATAEDSDEDTLA
ncbi:enhanced serine sensitivity protein SseB C-terminal domain-containing protein [Hymenobacter sp. 15J16-1T3B]|uniref:enhanced serine sensitivity protein SseB C-terminal domain-containing protein n=1 Tax=Hymenobacter sp. 15J16-1T3B TaxID=2886941 RepID=UPI001D0F80B2|nr:enhanced serine sensitivity protein SseB C-terminal domain-containing protein [Hymenobacter sp. 15J16-1T3B]MCC3160043.1 enhanced serine sensitivity protein SseB C-terminal domain-containing protein [Hymenobacter sp. 15J16-1T3B]